MSITYYQKTDSLFGFAPTEDRRHREAMSGLPGYFLRHPYRSYATAFAIALVLSFGNAMVHNGLLS